VSFQEKVWRSGEKKEEDRASLRLGRSRVVKGEGGGERSSSYKGGKTTETGEKKHAELSFIRGGCDLRKIKDIMSFPEGRLTQRDASRNKGEGKPLLRGKKKNFFPFLGLQRVRQKIPPTYSKRKYHPSNPHPLQPRHP